MMLKIKLFLIFVDGNYMKNELEKMINITYIFELIFYGAMTFRI